MRAVILAAGRGARLETVEPHVAKPMVRIGKIPVLQHTIAWLVRCGITEIIITAGPMAMTIMDHLEDGRSWGAHIEYTVESSPLGTAGGVAGAIRAFPEFGKEPLLIWHGDNFSTLNPIRMLDFHRLMHNDGTIAVIWRANATASSIVEWDQSNRILNFIEKPKLRSPHGWVSAGIYILEPSILEGLPTVGDFGYDVFPQMLLQNFRFHAYGLSYDEIFRWYDTPEDLLQLRKDYK